MGRLLVARGLHSFIIPWTHPSVQEPVALWWGSPCWCFWWSSSVTKSLSMTWFGIMHSMCSYIHLNSWLEPIHPQSLVQITSQWGRRIWGRSLASPIHIHSLRSALLSLFLSFFSSLSVAWNHATEPPEKEGKKGPARIIPSTLLFLPDITRLLMEASCCNHLGLCVCVFF